MHGESQRQSPWKSRKSATQIMKVGEVICVVDFHDLCLQQVRGFAANLSPTVAKSA